MVDVLPRSGPPFTEAALAAQAALVAKRAERRFGRPELFAVDTGDRSLTWEVRRFGGVLLQRGAETFLGYSFGASRW